MDVLMPQLGETVAEGKIVKWFKKAGDKVAAGDNLFEIETDKTSMEVPATSAGVLAEIRVAVGQVAPVGAVVAVIGGAGAAAMPKSATPKAAPPPMAAAFSSAKAPATQRSRARRRRAAAADCRATAVSSGSRRCRRSSAPTAAISSSSRSARCARPSATMVLHACPAARP